MCLHPEGQVPGSSEEWPLYTSIQLYTTHNMKGTHCILGIEVVLLNAISPFLMITIPPPVIV